MPRKKRSPIAKAATKGFGQYNPPIKGVVVKGKKKLGK